MKQNIVFVPKGTPGVPNCVGVTASVKKENSSLE